MLLTGAPKNYLDLHVNKTKEMIIDMRRRKNSKESISLLQ